MKKIYEFNVSYIENKDNYIDSIGYFENEYSKVDDLIPSNIDGYKKFFIPMINGQKVDFKNFNIEAKAKYLASFCGEQDRVGQIKQSLESLVNLVKKNHDMVMIHYITDDDENYFVMVSSDFELLKTKTFKY